MRVYSKIENNKKNNKKITKMCTYFNSKFLITFPIYT